MPLPHVEHPQRIGRLDVLREGKDTHARMLLASTTLPAAT
jgi:hypothetical protein